MNDTEKAARARRGRGEGAIWKDEKGVWRGQISLGGSGPLRKRRNYRAATRHKLVDAMARGRTQQVDGILPEPSATTVEQYLTHWITTHGAAVAGSTADLYARNFTNHINPTLGAVRLQKLKAADIAHTLNDIPGLALRLNILTALSGALKDACKQGIIYVNPCDRVKRPRPPKPEINPFDQKQAAAFIKAIAGHRYETVLILAIGTGARISEILAAEWRDFDLKATAGTWTIQRTLSEPSYGKIIAKTTKTRAGRRKIELDAKSVAALHAHRKATMKAGAAGQPLVFSAPGGAFLDRRAIYWSFRRLCKRAGLPQRRLHDLRHTHATLLFALGINPKVVSERLGHASIAITLQIYGHVLPAMESQAVEKFNRLFA